MGKRLAIIHWYVGWGGWNREFNRSELDMVSNRGSVPMITWEPGSGKPEDPAWTLRNAILSGKNDGYIDSWARGLADYGKPVILRFAHEMNDTSYSWGVGVNGNTAEEYVAAWKHVRAIFDRYNTSNVQWVWNPNILLGNPDALPLYRSLYPGDAYVDWLGLDIYNTGPNLPEWGAPYWQSFSQVLSAPYRAITALTDKPVILPEVGSAETGGSKAAWITEALTHDLSTEFPRVRALVWFDIVKEEDWTVESSPASYQAWIGAGSQPLFVDAPAFFRPRIQSLP